MGRCGYHLRCLNHRDKCSECKYQHKDKNEDYLLDVLGIWPKGKEADDVTELAFSQKVNVPAIA